MIPSHRGVFADEDTAVFLQKHENHLLTAP